MVEFFKHLLTALTARGGREKAGGGLCIKR